MDALYLRYYKEDKNNKIMVFLVKFSRLNFQKIQIG